MAYNVEPFEIVAGPAKVYLAPIGEAFPDINEEPAGNWQDMGDTEGGVSVEIGQDVTELSTDQVIAPIKVIRTGESVTITFALAEATLENLAKVLNDITVTDVAPGSGTAGYRKFELKRGPGPMAQHAMLIRGISPYGDWNLQFAFMRVMMTGNPSWASVKDDKVVFETEWKALYDLSDGTVGEIVAQDAEPEP